MKKAILSAKGLCKSFAHNGGQVHILSELDMDIYEGDLTVIMGASGSGKSTTLYSLRGMERATAGQVMYNGNDIVKMSEKQLAGLRHGDFGFIFQQMHLVSNLSLFENITVTGYLTTKGDTLEKFDSYTDQICEALSRLNVKTTTKDITTYDTTRKTLISGTVILNTLDKTLR